MRMIADAKRTPKPFDCILVHKFDRFARNREDSVVYKSLLRKEYGIRVISVTEQMEDDKFSIILESMLEAMAEYYSLNLSDEVKKGMTEKALRGELQTPAPLGYKMFEGTLTPDWQEANIVRIIFDLCANKDKKAGEIALLINEMGYYTKRGNRFRKRSIEYIIKNPVYMGSSRWRPSSKSEVIVTKGRHEPIVDSCLWYAANKNLTASPVALPLEGKPHLSPHYLSGILKCARCHGNMYLGGRKQNIFRCGNYLNGRCGYSQGISIKRIEERVLEEVFSVAQELRLRPHNETVRFIRENIYAVYYDKKSGSLVVKHS